MGEKTYRKRGPASSSDGLFDRAVRESNFVPEARPAGEMPYEAPFPPGGKPAMSLGQFNPMNPALEAAPPAAAASAILENPWLAPGLAAFIAGVMPQVANQGEDGLVAGMRQSNASRAQAGAGGDAMGNARDQMQQILADRLLPEQSRQDAAPASQVYRRKPGLPTQTKAEKLGVVPDESAPNQDSMDQRVQERENERQDLKDGSSPNGAGSDNLEQRLKARMNERARLRKRLP